MMWREGLKDDVESEEEEEEEDVAEMVTIPVTEDGKISMSTSSHEITGEGHDRSCPISS